MPPVDMEPWTSRARRGTTALATVESLAAAAGSSRTEQLLVGNEENDEDEDSALSSSVRRSPRLHRDAGRSLTSPKPIRQTGLSFAMLSQESAAEDRTRQRPGPRTSESGSVWEYVDLELREGKKYVSCRFCKSKPFQVTSFTRIVDHLLGRPGVSACTATSDVFLTLVAKLKREEDSKLAQRQRKRCLEMVSARSEADGSEDRSITSLTPANSSCKLLSTSGSSARLSQTSSAAVPTFSQPTLQMRRASKSDVDDAVSRFFYGHNISTNLISTPTFRKMCRMLQLAPLDYKPPCIQTFRTKCLTELSKTLRREEAPLREAVLRNCGTVLSDGWDGVDKVHLVNQLVGTCEGIFFDGTIELSSTDYEDASFVANAFSNLILRTGALSIVHLTSDTCSVMKAAWRIIAQRFSWVTITPCGTHCLSLYLKDLQKIEEFIFVETRVRKVLSLFWSKTRWPRMVLRETIEKNHNKDFGLYRAKATRFAGKIKEMARLLRAKSDLQEVVVSQAFQQRKANFGKKRLRECERATEADGDGDDGLPEGIGDVVRGILLDEGGFWATLVDILRITHPSVCLLRLLDGNKPCLGKVYHLMSETQESLNKLKLTVEWAEQAGTFLSARWEYLHSDFHCIAYALDPQYIEFVKDLDGHCQAGVFRVISRMSIRDAMLEAGADVSNLDKVAEAVAIFDDHHPAVAARVAKLEAEFGLYKRQASPFDRPSVRTNAKRMAPTEWWELYGSHLPLLQIVAQRVLAQPGSAYAAERNWSIYGQVKNEKRLRLKPERADMRVYCHEAIHLQEKLARVRDTKSVNMVEWTDGKSDCSSVADSESDGLPDDSEEELDISKLMR